MTDTEGDMWYWYHNISEAYYHIQLTVKYRKPLFTRKTEAILLDTIKEFKDRYVIEISHVGFDKNHVHFLCRFLPKYSGGQVIGLIKLTTAKQLFSKAPELRKLLWGNEFWTDGYYFSTVSGKGDKRIIEKYIENQGRKEDVAQLRMFEM